MMALRYSPIPYDHLVIPQGATFEANWYADDEETGLPADWTGWSARMQIRTEFEGELLATLATTGTRDGDIVLGEDGNITATLPDTYTVTMSPGGAVFDLNCIDPDGAAWRAVEGSVMTTPEVTTNA